VAVVFVAPLVVVAAFSDRLATTNCLLLLLLTGWLAGWLAGWPAVLPKS